MVHKTSENTSRKKFSGNKIALTVMTMLALAGAGAAGYLYNQLQSIKNDPKTLQQAQQSKAMTTKAKVAKLISVPADETPVLASVTDKAKLKDQPFFKDAENGDVILLFPQAKKAIIYRESSNMLINVGPIAITSDTKGVTQQTTTPAPKTTPQGQ